MTGQGVYTFFGVIIGIITFFGSWVYAYSQWGFLLGVGLGWIPSIFIAIIAGLVGPALLLIGGFVLLFFYVAEQL